MQSARVWFISTWILSCCSLTASPQEAFREAANLYIIGEQEAAKKSVDAALQTYSDDAQLQRLKQLLENPPQQNQQQQQNQSQQQSQQQNQEQQQQQQNDSDSAQQPQQQDSTAEDTDPSQNAAEEPQTAEPDQDSKDGDSKPENPEQEDTDDPAGNQPEPQQAAEEEDAAPTAESQPEPELPDGAMTREQARALLRSIEKHEKKLPLTFGDDKASPDEPVTRNW